MLCGPPTWNLRASHRCRLTVGGCAIEVFFDPDGEEVERRRLLPAPVLDWRQLDAVATLPYRIPIPWREVDLQTRILLDTLPRGVFASNANDVTRVWKPAVNVVALRGDASCWRTGIHELSMFASVAPRVVTLRTWPRDIGEARARAETLGVGVCAGEPRLRACTAPPTARYVREDARRWEVAESAYEQWLGGATVTSSAGAASSRS